MMRRIVVFMSLFVALNSSASHASEDPCATVFWGDYEVLGSQFRGLANSAYEKKGVRFALDDAHIADGPTFSLNLDGQVSDGRIVASWNYWCANPERLRDVQGIFSYSFSDRITIFTEEPASFAEFVFMHVVIDDSSIPSLRAASEIVVDRQYPADSSNLYCEPTCIVSTGLVPLSPGNPIPVSMEFTFSFDGSRTEASGVGFRQDQLAALYINLYDASRRPCTGTFSVASCSGMFSRPFDRPAVQDYDGDRRRDLATYSSARGTWLTRYNTGASPMPETKTSFGRQRMVPVCGDFDGDHKSDVAAFEPASGSWYIQSSATMTLMTGRPIQWGWKKSLPVPADYDGDGRTDLAVFDPETGTWFVLQSSTGNPAFHQWGFPGVESTPFDHDGDGRDDLCVYDEATGNWFIWDSGLKSGLVRQWGGPGAIPVPAHYEGGDYGNIGVFWPRTKTWNVLSRWMPGGALAYTMTNLPRRVMLPVVGDYDGDGRDDPAVVDGLTGRWRADRLGDGATVLDVSGWGSARQMPIGP